MKILYSFNDIYQIDKNKIIQKKEIYQFYNMKNKIKMLML